MAVTEPFLTLPPDIAFSKNDIPVIVNSPTTFQAAAPANAVGYFQFAAAVAADATVGIDWTANSAIMTAADTPDGSGNQFPDGDGSAAYVESLVPFFQANFFIDQAFTVSSDITGEYPRLIFTARQPGAAYNMPAGIASGQITAGVDNVSITNFNHHVEVWVDDGTGTGNFIQQFTANVPLDIPLTGLTTIDIHEILHAALSSDIPILNAQSAKCVNSIRAYFIKYAQYFGSVPAIQAIASTTHLFVNKGGLGMQPSLLRDIVAELCPVTGDATKNLFLRLGSKNKLVTMDQPEWLTYINFSGDTLLAYLEVTLTNSDGSTTVFKNGIVSMQPYDKYQFQAGFNQLDILDQIDPGVNVIYYTCRLREKNLGVAIYLSDTYNFVVDYNYRSFPGYFVYENSYGAFQTLSTVGKGQLEYDRAKDDAQQSLNRAQAASIGDFIEANITQQQKGTVAIGYDRSNTRITSLQRDFLLSHTKFLYENGVLIPIGLNTKNLKDAMDGVNVYANSIEYFYLYEDEVWTETLPQTDDALTQLIGNASSPVPPSLLPSSSNEGAIVVQSDDAHLSIVDGQQVYTAPILVGKTGYPISATQLGEGDPANGPYFRTSDIAYDSVAGSFRILVPGFVLNEGDQLIILPYVLDPDS